MSTFRLITVQEYQTFFNLIEKNRSRLLRYFPTTLQSIQSVSDARQHLEESIADYERREYFPFGIYDDEQLIGMIVIKNIDWRVPKAELGYYIDKDSEGKGVMTEVIRQIIPHAFVKLKINKLFLRTDPENIGSQKIALKNGFVKEGVLRKEFRVETGELIDLCYYGLVNEEGIVNN